MDLHGFLIVDKPRGLSSHDVVSRIRRLLRTRKVGHAGTLDPAAEGVLVIAIGRATKLLSHLTNSTKQYGAHIVLGVESLTGDIEGPASPGNQQVTPPSDERLNEVLEGLTGEIEQIPPSHAAIKVAGQPLYARARRGEPVSAPPRRVTIYSLELLDYQYPDLFVTIECSAGTYIRSLARDIGIGLGTGAYLHYLLRIRSGNFDLAQAWSLAGLEQRLSPASFASMAIHPSIASRADRAVLLDSEAARAWYDGRPVAARLPESPSELVPVFREDGTWAGVGHHDFDRHVYQPRIVVHE